MVAAKSSQSHLPPHCLSLNSMPPAQPRAQRKVSSRPSMKPPTRCFGRLLSRSQQLLVFFIAQVSFQFEVEVAIEAEQAACHQEDFACGA